AKAAMEVFNWKLRQFEAVTLPAGGFSGRSQHVGALLGDGTVLLAGGATGDPAASVVAVTANAVVFQLGARTGTTWAGAFLPVNGDMVVGRRGADNAVMMAGRPFIAGGFAGSGQTIATCEVYTPDRSRNGAPKAYVYLPSSDLSHAFGAPIAYRVVDAEGDQARIVAQFRHPLNTTYNACTAQATTIGGDIADDAAGLATTTTDLDGTQLLIDPVARNTTGDHAYIWAMSQDIDRPDVGSTVSGYTIRVTPSGAVRGEQDVTDPVNVLYNTKAITTILPLEDSFGVPNAHQGGDIAITVHIRDIDGAGLGPRTGEPCSVLFEYAIDLNGDSQITAQQDKDWTAMTAARLSTGNAATPPNPVTGVSSWSEAADDASSEPATRPAAKGWVTFEWDALFDLGPPPSATGYQVRNIWLRVTATDPLDLGFPKIVRNKPGQPDDFDYERDLEGLWLESWAPRSSSKSLVKVNEPIDFVFNGNIDGATVNSNTLKIYRGNTVITGEYQVQNDTVVASGVTIPTAGKSTVTFHPQVQNLNSGAAAYGVNDASTIYFPGNQYRIQIPGYAFGGYPLADIPPGNSPPEQIRPIGYGTDPSLVSTYELVNSTPVNGDVETQFQFNTTTGSYADGQAVDYSDATPGTGTTLDGSASGSGFSITVNHALDVTTATSPNLTVTGNSGSSYVVPGRWTVTNTINNDGTSSSNLVFVPLFKLPSGDSIVVSNTSGLRGTNGTSVAGLTGLAYTVNGYGRTTTSFTETFTDATNRDSA
ncbi:MAG: hypothetical protein FD127_3740, partial [Acidimicrobiaceae bacterium]